MKPPRLINEMQQNEQIKLFSGQAALPESYLCFSRFRAAANHVMGKYEQWIGCGDKQNEIENALARAYEQGWEDAQK